MRRLAALLILGLPLALSASEINPPTAFVFGGATQTTVSDLQPASFITTSDTFASSASFTTYSVGSAGTVTITGGVATIAGTGTTNTIIAQTASSFSMPQAFVSTTVSQNGTDTASADYAGVGIVKDGSNFVTGEVDRIRNLALIRIRISGIDTITHVSFTPPSAPYQIGFSLIGNGASMYVNSGAGWVWELSAFTKTQYDFTASGNLTGWHGGIEAGSNNIGTTWKFAQPLNIGYFGTVAVSDIYAVINKDGSPYISGGLAYFTASCPDGQGYSSSAGQWTLYMCTLSYDLTSGVITQLGGIMFTRSGSTLNDVSGNLVIDSGSGTYYVVATELTNLPSTVQIEIASTSTNLLTGFNAVTASTLTLPLATGGNGAEDASLVYNSGTSLWNLSYAVLPGGTNFYPALASSPDLSTWTAIGNDSASTGYEESRVTLNAGSLYFMWGGPFGTGNTVRVYDATMTYKGNLNATIGPTSIMDPGANVFGYGYTEYLVYWNQVGFNSNNFTWGQWVVQTAPRYTPDGSYVSGYVPSGVVIR